MFTQIIIPPDKKTHCGGGSNPAGHSVILTLDITKLPIIRICQNAKKPSTWYSTCYSQ